MATRNTLSHPPLSLSLNTHIAFLQNAIIALLTEQSKLCDKIDRLKGLVEELRWETRRDAEILRERMGCPSCMSGSFTAVQELVRDRKEGIEEDLWGGGSCERGI